MSSIGIECAISGISGRFPESEDIEEFWIKLINGHSLTTLDERRWPSGLYSLPPITGRIQTLNKVDADFFDLNDDINNIDPSIRIDYEVIFEAIWDAGVNPFDLRGTPVSLIRAICHDDTDCAISRLPQESFRRNGAGEIAANFGFLGPCFDVDAACASSLLGLHEGFNLINKKLCKSFVVVGNAIQLNPTFSFIFKQIKMTSAEGTTKCLDEAADGYCRSEAIGALFVQRKNDAKRIYASILSCVTNTDGYKEEGITFPKDSTQYTLMKTAIKKANIDPLDIEFIEGHITGTPAGDPVECRSILKAFRGDSKKPLLIGCLKSNIGHTEASSGVCAITKIALIFQKGEIPANIFYKRPNPNIEGLISGQLLPVIKKMTFDGEVISTNSFGIGGSNVTCILKANEKRLNYESFTIVEYIPRLINICGRTEEGITHTIKWIESNRDKVTVDFLSLLNDVSKTPLHSKMNHRGYMIIDKYNNCVGKQISHNPEKRELWFLFTGFGGFWPGMAAELMNFEPFAASIETSVKIANDLGINLLNVVTNPNFELKNHDKECTIGIVAVQLALFDTLTCLGLMPDKYVGVSLGDITCSIVDGCLSRKEVFEALSYVFDELSKRNNDETLLILADGDIRDIELLCPNGVQVATDFRGKAFHLFGGEKKEITEFSERLTSANIPWRTADTFNLAFFRPGIESNIEMFEGISDNSWKKQFVRSTKWLSTSYKNEETVTDKRSLIKSSMFNKIYMQKAIDSIPENSCVVELNSQPLTFAILKVALKVNRTFVATMRRFTPSNIQSILSAIGDIYTCGHNPQIEKLYPSVDYPVARETASLSHLMKWDHSKDFFVAKYPHHFNNMFRNHKVFDLKSSEFEFLKDHKIDGRILFPSTGYIYYAWRQISFAYGFGDLCPYIEFRKIRIVRATIPDNDNCFELEISINRVCGDFVITSQDNICVTGNARIVSQMEKKFVSLKISGDSGVKLDQDSAYKELRVRGYDYGPHFQGIIELDSNGEHAKVKSFTKASHLISHGDSILHLLLFNQKTRDLFIPTQYEWFSIDLPRLSQSFENKEVIDVYYEKETGMFYTDGIVGRNVTLTPIPRRCDPNLMLKYYSFSPFDNSFCYTQQEISTMTEHNSLCLLLIKSLRNQNFHLNERLTNDLNKFVGDRFAMLNSLREAVKEKLSLKDFITKLTDKELNGFPLTLSKKELMEEQIQIFLQNKESKQISVIEINDTEYTFEITVKELCRLCDCRCDYKIMKSESIDKLSTAVDLIIVKHFSAQLVLSRNKNESNLYEQILQKSVNKLRNGGFLLFYCRTKLTDFENEICGIELENGKKIVNYVIENDLFSRISTKTDSLYFTSILIRRIRRIENEALIRSSGVQFDWINAIKTQLMLKKKICLKARPKEINGVIGFSKCLQEEYGSHTIRCVIEDDIEIGENIFSRDLSLNIKLENEIGTLLLKQFNQELVPTRHAFVDITTKGDLRSLRWLEAPHKLWDELTVAERGETNFLINVYYGALNFKDIMIATNRISFSAFPMKDYKSGLLGMEFAGIDENGKRIFGICESNSIATTLVQNIGGFHFEVPSIWTLKEASTVPMVYATVYYALIMRAKLLRNETILIHAGSGGVGQASVRLCLSMNCNVFTSVGNQEKKEELMELFPQLKERNIVDSRSLSFEEKIMKETNGRGVDVVLNSLAEEKLQASINCVAEGGRFIEIGKYDIVNDNKFVRHLRNVTFEVICLAHLLFDAVGNKRESAIKKVTELRELITEGIEKGVVQPLQATTFNKDQVEDAFRFMAAGKHFGKVVIQIREESESEVFVKAIPKAYFYPSKVYLIIGGLGGMGLQLAFWLSKRGARKVVLTTTHGITDVYQKYMIELIERNAAEVRVVLNDLSDMDLAMELLQQCSNIGPIGGIFNLAISLNDQNFEDLTEESMLRTCKPKLHATNFLDTVSRNICPKIDYFVCFSSLVASMGNNGQSSYAFANSAMEMICKKRKRDGYHALAIQWGLIGDVGVYLEKAKRNDAFSLGMKPQRIFSCYETLDVFLASKHTVCATAVPAKLKQSIAQIGDVSQQIFHILGITDTNNINLKMKIADLGADSLMSVEIRQMLEKHYNIQLTSQQMKELSFQELRNLVAEKFPKLMN